MEKKNDLREHTKKRILSDFKNEIDEARKIQSIDVRIKKVSIDFQDAVIILEWLESRLQEQGREGWIDVRDRLPKNTNGVLAYTVEGEKIISSYVDGFWFCKGPYQGDVTHWRNLPAPPEK